MEKIKFSVQGSAEEPYIITFTKEGLNLNAYCTCPAGENGLYCKHRFRILDGLTENIISNNLQDVQKVLSWLPGTDIETALVRCKNAEKSFEMAKSELQLAKKNIVKVFRD